MIVVNNDRGFGALGGPNLGGGGGGRMGSDRKTPAPTLVWSFGQAFLSLPCGRGGGGGTGSDRKTLVLEP